MRTDADVTLLKKMANIQVIKIIYTRIGIKETKESNEIAQRMVSGKAPTMLKKMAFVGPKSI